jgi:hypothetical protein
MHTADFELLDLSQAPPGTQLEATLTLAEPQPRLRVRVPPGRAGRAEAVFLGKSWAAKHYWQESPGVVVYEFDEAIPAGPLTLRIPFSPSEHDEATPGAAGR